MAKLISKPRLYTKYCRSLKFSSTYTNWKYLTNYHRWHVHSFVLQTGECTGSLCRLPWVISSFIFHYSLGNTIFTHLSRFWGVVLLDSLPDLIWNPLFSWLLLCLVFSIQVHSVWFQKVNFSILDWRVPRVLACNMKN